MLLPNAMQAVAWYTPANLWFGRDTHLQIPICNMTIGLPHVSCCCLRGGGSIGNGGVRERQCGSRRFSFRNLLGGISVGRSGGWGRGAAPVHGRAVWPEATARPLIAASLRPRRCCRRRDHRRCGRV